LSDQFSKGANQSLANLGVPSNQPEQAKEGPSNWERTAAALAGVAGFAGEFAKEQIHAAGQDLVSRVLLDETYSHKSGEKEPEPSHDKDQGLDR
jgi:hypothetical protein